MVDYREILRLNSLGNSQRQIERRYTAGIIPYPTRWPQQGKKVSLGRWMKV